MDIDNFITHIKTEDIYKDIAKDVGERFNTSKYELKRSPLKVKKNKKVICLMKNELAAKVFKEFVGLRAKTYNYLTDDKDEGRKTKGMKICVIQKLFQDYKNSLKAPQLENKLIQLHNSKTDGKSFTIMRNL